MSIISYYNSLSVMIIDVMKMNIFKLTFRNQ